VPTWGNVARTCLAALPRTALYAFTIDGRLEFRPRSSVTASSDYQKRNDRPLARELPVMRIIFSIL
jgi:hypothetical protein